MWGWQQQQCKLRPIHCGPGRHLAGDADPRDTKPPCDTVQAVQTWAGRQDHTVRECRAIEALTMLTCHNTSAKAALEYQLPERCRWAYALLANLASPVHRDTLADVRELFVAASGLYIGFRKRRDPTFDASLRSLAVLCVVTGRHFRQAE